MTGAGRPPRSLRTSNGRLAVVLLAAVSTSRPAIGEACAVGSCFAAGSESVLLQRQGALNRQAVVKGEELTAETAQVAADHVGADIRRHGHYKGNDDTSSETMPDADDNETGGADVESGTDNQSAAEESSSGAGHDADNAHNSSAHAFGNASGRASGIAGASTTANANENSSVHPIDVANANTQNQFSNDVDESVTQGAVADDDGAAGGEMNASSTGRAPANASVKDHGDESADRANGSGGNEAENSSDDEGGNANGTEGASGATLGHGESAGDKGRTEAQVVAHREDDVADEDPDNESYSHGDGQLPEGNHTEKKPEGDVTEKKPAHENADAAQETSQPTTSRPIVTRHQPNAKNLSDGDDPRQRRPWWWWFNPMHWGPSARDAR